LFLPVGRDAHALAATAAYVLALTAPGKLRDASFRRDGDLGMFAPGKLSGPSFRRIMPHLTVPGGIRVPR